LAGAVAAIGTASLYGSTATEKPRSCATFTWPIADSTRMGFSLRCNFDYNDQGIDPTEPVERVRLITRIKPRNRDLAYGGDSFDLCSRGKRGNRIVCSGVMHAGAKAIGSFYAGPNRCEVRTRFWVLGGRGKRAYESARKKPLGCRRGRLQ
jgi:hypothetical protein